MTRLQAVVPVLIGGAMALGQAPWGLVFPVFAALALFAAQGAGQSSPRRAAWYAFRVGFGYFSVALHWIVYPFLVEPDLFAWMAPFAAVLLPAGLSLFWAGGAWLGQRLGGGRAGWALGLIIAELARAHLFTGFPWVQFADAYLDTVTAPQIANFGAQGLSVLLIALAAVASVGAGRGWRGWILPVAISGVLAVPLGPDVAPASADAPIVRLVQPNAPQEDKWNPLKVEEFYQRMLAASAADGSPDLIVWPETAVPWLLSAGDPLLAEVAEVAGGVPVALGINRGQDGLYYNSLALVGAGGEVFGTYDKRHLVPFGEYVPFGEALASLGIHGLAASDGAAFAAGQQSAALEVPNIGRIWPLICYEGIFPGLSDGAQDARMILLVTNDAWFGPKAGPLQHLAQARLRAIETGVPVVRVANTGVSAVMDGQGAVVASLGLGAQGFIDVALPDRGARPLYSVLGPWPLSIGVIAILCMILLRRRYKPIDPEGQSL